VSRQYTDALNTVDADPTGQSGEMPSYTTLNAAVNLALPVKGLSGYLSVTNLTDRRYLVSRVNGAVAGAPRQVVAGLRLAY
jgi:Fe(3+) dicitrate transport protein